MSVRIIVLPDPIHAKGVTECKVLGTISDEEYKLLKEKLKLFTPKDEIYGRLVHGGGISVDIPPDVVRGAEYIIDIKTVSGEPHFRIGEGSLAELKEEAPQDQKEIKVRELGTKAPEFFKLIDSYMRQTGHKTIQIGIDPLPVEGKKYSVEGKFDIDRAPGCYVIYLYELDPVSKNDFLGWRWVTPDSREFKITYSAKDFRFDEDFVDPEPELAIMVFKWTGSGRVPVGKCVKLGGKYNEKVSMRIGEDANIEIDEDGWECGKFQKD